jgi:hypothetical protein
MGSVHLNEAEVARHRPAAVRATEEEMDMRALAVGVALLVFGLPAPSLASTSVRVGVSIGNAPPPPIVAFRTRPRFEYAPDYRVYVIDDDRYDYDCFQYGNYFYLHNGDWWYRARSYRGPFVAVEMRVIPRVVYTAHTRGLRGHVYGHGMPPGQAKKRGYEDRRDNGHGGKGRHGR